MAAAATAVRAAKIRRGSLAGRLMGRALAAVVLLGLVWLTPACQVSQGNEGLKKEVEALKNQVAGLKDKITEMEATQKVMLEMMKNRSAAAPVPAMPGLGTELPGLPPAAAGAPGAPGAPGALMTIDELFRHKDQLLGTRVTVRGLPGPVLMHKKTLFLGGPGGMVEVIYGNIQDRKQVERLTSQTIETPVTVSGLLSTTPGQGKDQVRLIIMADSVQF